jgi:hypothetical protein
MKKNLDWFKNEIAPKLAGYDLKYQYFEEGDFGSLNKVEFNSSKIGGGIDFWGLNWLGIFLWDYTEEKELMNILLEPDQDLEKEEAFDNLLNFL